MHAGMSDIIAILWNRLGICVGTCCPKIQFLHIRIDILVIVKLERIRHYLDTETVHDCIYRLIDPSQFTRTRTTKIIHQFNLLNMAFAVRLLPSEHPCIPWVIYIDIPICSHRNMNMLHYQSDIRFEFDLNHKRSQAGNHLCT